MNLILSCVSSKGDTRILSWYIQNQMGVNQALNTERTEEVDAGQWVDGTGEGQ